MKKITKGMTMTTSLAVLLLLVAAQFCAAATWTVSSTADDGVGTLRAALAGAVDGDTIDFSFNDTIKLTIKLTSGELVVDKSVSIIVPAGYDVTVDGGNATRVFSIAKDKTVLISGLTIANGYALGNGGGVHNAGILTLSDCTLSNNSANLGGGGVFNQGQLTITDCTLSGNQAGISEDLYKYEYICGGAVAVAAIEGPTINFIEQAYAELTIDNSLLTNNIAPCGGGIAVEVFGGDGNEQSAGALVTVKDSTLSDNVATHPDYAYGGAMAISVAGNNLRSTALVRVENCTLSGNSATGSSYAMGGGIAIYAPQVDPYIGILTLKNSTLSSNSALAGGAMWLWGKPRTYNSNSVYYSSEAILENCTLSGNWDTNGVSGILNDGGKVELKNTILANDSSGINLYNGPTFIEFPRDDGTVISHGYNLSTDGAGDWLTDPFDFINTDPMLGPLADNGGPTLTHALLIGSPAIDAGNETAIVIPGLESPPDITKDQRGIARPQGDYNDIGAFEHEVSEFKYWSGVLPPVNPDGTSVFKAGSTVPVKFMLTGSSAGITDLTATLKYAKIADSSPGIVNESVSTSAATTGDLFRYDPASGEYLFNWSTKGLTQGSYRLYIYLGDGVVRSVDVGLK